MSSSNYCQGIQSCLEVEPRVLLRLKLAPPETNIFPSDSKSSSAADDESGGWSFLQSLAKHQPVSKDQVYIPPNCKRGLSEKSLEMCTESLGSESGSDGAESGDEMNLLSSDYENQEIAGKPSKLRETTRMNRRLSLPPPLSSISGASNFQMRQRREGGRLVLEAVSVSTSSQAYFKAERIDGCLRLHLIKDCISDNDDDEEEEEEEENEVDDEEEMEKLKRLSRCGSGNQSSSLLTWEPFWVAT